MNRILLPKAFLAIALFAGGCSSARYFLRYNIPNVTDTKIFPSDTVHKADEPFTFCQTENRELPPAFFWANGKKVSAQTTAEQFLEENSTTALLIIRNDTILYEKYFDGYYRGHTSQVFSITKSVTSMLTGIAIAEGYFKSADQPVSDFLSGFSQGKKGKLTLNHLLQMTAGYPSDYRSWGKLANLYYTSEQAKFVRRLKQRSEPGEEFSYSSAATQILGMCLEKATGRRFADYLEEKLWKPLGMEYDAHVALDKRGGDAKMYAGLAASAVDLAKLGRLYLNNGNWNGRQLVPQEWVLASRCADTTNGRSRRYAYGWWLDTYPRLVGYCDNDFFAGGFKGQVMYVNPNDNTIIVRLGKREKGVFWPHAMSKLALIQECQDNGCDAIDLLVLEGNYKSKNGTSFNLKSMNDRLVLENFHAPGYARLVELIRESNISFCNKNKELKIIVDFRNRQVKGFFLEVQGQAEFFEKI